MDKEELDYSLMSKDEIKRQDKLLKTLCNIIQTADHEKMATGRIGESVRRLFKSWDEEYRNFQVSVRFHLTDISNIIEDYIDVWETGANNTPPNLCDDDWWNQG